MKKSILTLFVFAISLAAQAQESKSAPRTEFTLDLSAATLKVNAGESSAIDLSILRSKTYKKSNAVLGLSTSLPEGITVEFEPNNGVIEKTNVKVIASRAAKPGEYLLILKATLQNHTKGATLKLVVEDATNTATTSGR
jgi:uncharacterized membrane protein